LKRKVWPSAIKYFTCALSRYNMVTTVKQVQYRDGDGESYWIKWSMY